MYELTTETELITRDVAQSSSLTGSQTQLSDNFPKWQILTSHFCQIVFCFVLPTSMTWANHNPHTCHGIPWPFLITFWLQNIAHFVAQQIVIIRPNKKHLNTQQQFDYESYKQYCWFNRPLEQYVHPSMFRLEPFRLNFSNNNRLVIGKFDQTFYIIPDGLVGNLLLEIFQHTELFLSTAFISLVQIRLNEDDNLHGEQKQVLNNLLITGISVFFVDWFLTTIVSQQILIRDICNNKFKENQRQFNDSCFNALNHCRLTPCLDLELGTAPLIHKTHVPVISKVKKLIGNQRANAALRYLFSAFMQTIPNLTVNQFYETYDGCKYDKTMTNLKIAYSSLHFLLILCIAQINGAYDFFKKQILRKRNIWIIFIEHKFRLQDLKNKLEENICLLSDEDKEKYYYELVDIADNQNLESTQGEILNLVVKRNGGSLNNDTKVELKSDKHFVKYCQRENGSCLEYADNKLKIDQDFMLDAVKYDGSNLIYAGKNYKKDYEFMLEAVKYAGSNFEYVDNELKRDKNFMLESIKFNLSNFKQVDKELQKDKEVVLQAIKNGLNLVEQNLQKDKDIMIEAIKYDLSNFEYVDNEIKRDKQFMLESIKFNLSNFKQVDKELQKNKEVVLQAIKNGLNLVEQNLQKDKDIMIEAVKYDVSNFKQVDMQLQDDKEIMMEAVKYNGLNLQFADNILKKDKEVVLEAVKNNGLSLEFVDNILKKDQDVVLEAVKNNGSSLFFAEDILMNDKDIVFQAKKNLKK